MATPARYLLTLLTGFCAAALLASACGEQDYPATSFRCDPGQADSCPSTHLCCSTDPAAIDLDNLNANAIPEYAGGSGVPVFSGSENGRSDHGRCVDPATFEGVEVIDAGSADGCPRPCNPNWDATTVGMVCGADAFCCQTDEIGELDCAFDPASGAAGCWRPVTGRDIESLGGLDASDWGPTDHDTHQDPRGDSCRAFVEGVDAGGNSIADLQVACYRQLTVASHRGLCTPAGGAELATVCPLADPEYRDACDLENEAEGLSGC